MIISAQTLITGDGSTVLTDGAVLVSGDKITAVGSAQELLAAHPQQEYLDYGEATILPGLIDMHLHLGYFLGRADEALYTEHLAAYLALNNAERMLKGGVTTVRDVFSPNGLCRQLALAAHKGWVRVPRIIHCNRALTISGGIDWQSGGATVQVDGSEQIRKAVREEFREGAHWIKAMTSWRTPGVAQFDQDELDAIVRECHRQGHKAAAHASLQPAIGMCIEAGFDTIEHGTDLTVEQASAMQEKGLAWVPTIYVHKAVYERLENKLAQGQALTEREQRTHTMYAACLDTYHKNFMALYNTGVLTLAGTDCVFDGMEDITVAWELACMVDYGLSPVQAIATATGNAALALEMRGQIGELIPGANADIAVAEGNAAQDIGALKHIKAVFQDGIKIPRAY